MTTFSYLQVLILLTLCLKQNANAFVISGYHSVAAQGAFNANMAMTRFQASSSSLFYKNLEDYEEQQQYKRNDPTSSKPSQNLIQEIKNNSDGYDVLIAEELTGSPAMYQNLDEEYTHKMNIIDLPKTAFLKSGKNRDQEAMLSLEMYIGRIAMLIAIYLSMEMVLTGSTVLDRIQSL